MAVDYFSRVGRVESGNNPNARNPNSSASGQFQFIDSTFLPYARRIMPGVSDQELLARKNDPQLQRQAMEMFTNDNRTALTNAGHKATDGNLYLAHFAGPAGAMKVLSADPTTPVGDLLGAGAVKANGFLSGMTAGDLQKWAENKMAGTSGVQTEQNAQQNQQQGATPWTDSMLQGGPMALFGMGQQGYNWGNALIGAGAALASISSPQQGAVLAAMRSPQRGNDVDVEVDKSTGMVYMINRRTGQVQTKQDPNIIQQKLDVLRAQKKIEDELKDYKPTSQTEKMFAENHTNVGNLMQNLNELETYQKAFAEGRIDMSLLGRVRRGALTAADQNDPNLNLVSGFQTWLERMRNQTLQLNKGVQTEGDAIRAMNEFLSPSAQLNSAAAATNIAKLGRGFSDYAGRIIDQNESILKRSDKAAKYFDPDETFRSQYGQYRTGIKAQRDYYDSEYNRLTTPQQQQPTTQSTQQQQRDPSKLKNIFGF